MEKSEEVLQCRKCGCTDNDCSQCVEKTGRPCFWVTEDLCSACCDKNIKIKWTVSKT